LWSAEGFSGKIVRLLVAFLLLDVVGLFTLFTAAAGTEKPPFVMVTTVDEFVFDLSCTFV
jgi:hypothetical protein